MCPHLWNDGQSMGNPVKQPVSPTFALKLSFIVNFNFYFLPPSFLRFPGGGLEFNPKPINRKIARPTLVSPYSNIEELRDGNLVSGTRHN